MISQAKINELTESSRKIKNSLKSKTIKENILANILNKTNNSERQIIRTCYKRLYNIPIHNDLKGELSDNFKDLCLSMFDTPYEYDARELYKSLNTVPIKYKIIIEIFSSRNNSHLNVINQAYEQFFEKSLKEEISSKISKSFGNFLFLVMSIPRKEEKSISNDDAYKFANFIKEKNSKILKDENIFKDIFLEKSREDLILISRAFFELYKINLYEYIKGLKTDNVDINNKKLTKNILFAVISPSEWFSKKLRKSIKGVNIDYDQLNRIMIYRSDIDIDIIKDYYFINYGNDLEKDLEIIKENSYREVLNNLCRK